MLLSRRQIAIALALGLLLGGCDLPAPPADLSLPPAPTRVAGSPPTATAASSASGPGLTVRVDTTQRHAISPLIYGLADPTTGHEDLLRWMGIGLARWGGNARTMHNWEINASNAGSDWEFRNVSQGDSTPGSASLGYLKRNAAIGAGSLLTIPTIGWVAKDGDNDTQSINVPKHGGPPTAPGADSAFTRFANGVWSAPYDPAANRARTSVRSLPSKNAPFSYPPDLNDGAVYQDEWVAYLRSVRPAGLAGPMIYAMDNEPELWADDTHVDVHPARLGYDDELALFTTYARAVKKADPGALVAGPVSWGVTGYLFSALDEGGDNFNTAADRAAHGGVPWLQWFLDATHKSDIAAGSRSLDVLDVHAYPNAGEYDGGSDRAMQEKRIQSTRALWDGLFVEPSWVARTEWANMALLRRLKTLISTYYPGTKIGVSEWAYGGEDDISGALATADALGIFGREDVYYSACWCLPHQGSPTAWAFRLYRNYDGQGGQFGAQSVDTESSNPETLSAYGALDDAGRLTLVLINKDFDNAASVGLNLNGFKPGAKITLYSYGSGSDALAAQSIAAADLGKLNLPPLSMNLLLVTPQQ